MEEQCRLLIARGFTEIETIHQEILFKIQLLRPRMGGYSGKVDLLEMARYRNKQLTERAMKKIILNLFILFMFVPAFCELYLPVEEDIEWCQDNKIMAYEEGKIIVVDDCSRLNGECIVFDKNATCINEDYN